MEQHRYRFEIEVRRPQGGAFLDRVEVDPVWLEPLVDEAVWLARRRGVVDSDPSRTWSDVEPMFTDEPGRRVDSVRVRVGGTNGAATATNRAACEPGLSREFELGGALQWPVDDVLRGLIAAKRLEVGDKYEVSYFARPLEHGPTATATGKPLEVVVEEAPLLLAEGSSEDLRGRAKLLQPEARHEDDTEIFIREEAYEQVLRSCRSGGTRESGAMLVGRLFRQSEPHDIFVVIEAAFEARHAEQKTFSLEPTTETWVHLERQLARRRKRLGRPEETLVGEAHGHPFLPALDADGKPLCPGCEKRPVCKLHSAFFSADDVQFHTSLFRKRVFAIGMVWGLTPREEDVLRVYGFRGGRLAERALWLVHGN